MLQRFLPLLALATAVAVTAPLPAAAQPGCGAPRQNELAEVLHEVNSFRAQNGLRPLRANRQLTRAAQLHACDMAAMNKMSHHGSDGSSIGQRLSRVGYPFRAAGENIAHGRFQAQDGSPVDWWRNSPGHRANMLDNAFTEAGVGLTPGPNGRNYWVLVMGRS